MIEWRVVPGFPAYEVSSTGLLRGVENYLGLSVDEMDMLSVLLLMEHLD